MKKTAPSPLARVAPLTQEQVTAIREQRIDVIVDRMSRGEWYGSRSHRELAVEWSCGVASVQDYASTASAIVRRCIRPEDAEALRLQLFASLQEALRLAQTRQGYTMAGEAYANPDVKGMVSACGEMAKLLSLTTAKVEVTATPYAQLSHDEKVAKLRASLPEIQRIIAADDAAKKGGA